MTVQQDLDHEMLYMQKDVKKLQEDLSTLKSLTNNLIKIGEKEIVQRSDVQFEMYDLVGDLQRRTRLTTALLVVAIMILAVWQLVC